MGKKVRVRKHQGFVFGKEKPVLYGEPYLEPQKTLEGKPVEAASMAVSELWALQFIFQFFLFAPSE
jgi:hypothetical protein